MMIYLVIRLALAAHLGPDKFLFLLTKCQGEYLNVLKKSQNFNVIEGQAKSLLVGITSSYFGQKFESLK